MNVSSLPTGTVTFLFTDIEGSTKLWQQHPEPMKDAWSDGAAMTLEQAITHAREEVTDLPAM